MKCINATSLRRKSGQWGTHHLLVIERGSPCEKFRLARAYPTESFSPSSVVHSDKVRFNFVMAGRHFPAMHSQCNAPSTPGRSIAGQ
jgi:hypothetical protein